MATDYEKLLTQVGFLPSEVKVYLAALELGSTSVQNIAKKAAVSRTAAYEAIEALQRRGLISSTMRGKRRVYAAEDPERIVSHLKEEQQKFESTLSDIQRQVDAMRLMAGGIKPAVRTYEGEEALHAYFQHVSEVAPEAMDEITNIDDVYESLSEDAIMRARRTYKWNSIKTYRIVLHGEPRNPRSDVQIRSLPEKWGEFHGNISIYNKYIALVTHVGKAAVVIIESDVLADTMRLMFNVIWEGANPKK